MDVAETAPKAAAVAGLVILAMVGSLFLVSYLVVVLLRIPPSLGLQPLVNAVGVASVGVGVAFVAWVFRYRSPSVMVASTYVTLMKLLGRLPFAEKSGREELLVVAGPQRYVRNPLYFAVILVVLGWGLVGGVTFVLVAALVVSLWFRFVLIPFEEKELLALFGAQYARYQDDVPMLIPFIRIRRRNRRVAQVGLP